MLYRLYIIDNWRILFNQKIISILFLKICILGKFIHNMILINRFIVRLKLLRNSFNMIVTLVIVIVIHNCLKYMICWMYIRFAIRTSITHPKINSFFLASFTNRITVFDTLLTIIAFFAWFIDTKLYIASWCHSWSKYLMFMINIFLFTILTDI